MRDDPFGSVMMAERPSPSQFGDETAAVKTLGTRDVDTRSPDAPRMHEDELRSFKSKSAETAAWSAGRYSSGIEA